MKPYLSLIIPAYNEEARLESSLAIAFDYLGKKDYSCEILVADDGSNDRTAEIAKNHIPKVNLLSLPRNMGKGAAVRQGMLAAKGDIRIFADADFSTPIYELEKILNKLQNGCDVAIGSRAIDNSMIKVHQPFYREFMGKTFNKIVQLIAIRGIKDTQCGFKGFTEKAVELIFPKAKIDGFGFDVEILYLARIAGLTIEEVAVEWYNDTRSTVNPISDSLKMFGEIFKVKWIHRK
jgi:dolichyl-phosphate beta-glucosyltransferase